MIEESDDDDEVINNAGAIIPLTISRMFFIVLLKLTSILFQRNKLLLFHQCVSYFLEPHPVSIKNLSHKPQLIVAKHSPLDVFES